MKKKVYREKYGYQPIEEKAQITKVAEKTKTTKKKKSEE